MIIDFIFAAGIECEINGTVYEPGDNLPVGEPCNLKWWVGHMTVMCLVYICIHTFVSLLFITVVP